MLLFLFLFFYFFPRWLIDSEHGKEHGTEVYVFYLQTCNNNTRHPLLAEATWIGWQDSPQSLFSPSISIIIYYHITSAIEPQETGNTQRVKAERERMTRGRLIKRSTGLPFGTRQNMVTGMKLKITVNALDISAWILGWKSFRITPGQLSRRSLAHEAERKRGIMQRRRLPNDGRCVLHLTEILTDIHHCVSEER